MDDSIASMDALLRRGAERLKGHQRRWFLAEVTQELCCGNARQAERRFGWGRETINQGLHELRQGIRCLENFAARGGARWEDRDPRRASDIRALVEPHTHADPELKSSRRYTNWSAKELLEGNPPASSPHDLAGMPPDREAIGG